MSIIAERIRRFREGKPLPRNLRPADNPSDFWWLDDETSKSREENPKNNEYKLNLLNRESLYDNDSDESDEPIPRDSLKGSILGDGGQMPDPERIGDSKGKEYIDIDSLGDRGTVNHDNDFKSADDFRKSIINEIGESDKDPCDDHIPIPVSPNRGKSYGKASFKQGNDDNNNRNDMPIPLATISASDTSIPSSTSNKETDHSIYDRKVAFESIPFKSNANLPLSFDDESNRRNFDNQIRNQSKANSQSLYSNSRDCNTRSKLDDSDDDILAQNILEKESELTNYLDSKLDSLFSRVDSILEEYGLLNDSFTNQIKQQKSNQGIEQYGGQVKGFNDENPKALISGDPVMLTQSCGGNNMNEDTTLDRISRNVEIPRDEPISILHDSMGADIPMRKSSESVVLQDISKRLDDFSSILEKESNVKSSLNSDDRTRESNPVFFYLSSSFESASSLNIKPNYAADDRRLKSMADSIDKKSSKGNIGPLREEDVAPYLKDDIVNTMWKRLKYLRSLRD